MATTRTTKPTVTTASEWKKDSSSEEPLELPSGKYAQIRRHSMRTFLAAGILPNSLMGVVEKAINSGKQPTLSDLDIAKDPQKITEMMAMIDNIVRFCFINPVVHPVPDKDKGEERDDSQLYIDEIDEADKMFVFQWVTGGTSDLEQFRNELNSSLVAISGSQNVGRPTQRARRTTR